MRVLFFGGTSFLGRHLVEEALRRGDTVTLFNRGVTNPDVFPAAERLRGDREGDLGILAGRTWDAVVDTCGFTPGPVRASAQRLAGAAGHYSFVSSLSVMPDFSRPGCDESWPALPPDFASRDVTGETYGPLKRACEIEVERAFAERALVVRPGFIVGPYDNVPRLPYWLRRFARGGEVLARGGPTRPVQVVDARDIAAWVLDMAARGAGGLFHVTQPPGALTMGALLNVCRDVTGGEGRITWADEGWLAEAGLGFDALPYGAPASALGIMSVSIERAMAQGFAVRPFVETARDTWDWLRSLPIESPPHRRVSGGVAITAGIAPDHEARLLAAWHAAARVGSEAPPGQGSGPGDDRG